MSFHSAKRLHLNARARMVRGAGIIGSACLLFAASTAFSQPDVMMRDCYSDNGDIVAPGYTCGGDIYYSPDVWLRQNPDGGTTDQAPIALQPAYIYVHLYNRGNAESSCGVLCVYYRDATVSPGGWPSQWINFSIGGVIRADVVGKLDVCAMAPGEDRTVMIPWASVPDNSTGVHHCLLVRWIASDDPMQTVETSNMLLNVAGNNNIVHRNCIHTLPGNPPTPVSVFNPEQEDVNVQLKLDALDNDEGKNAFGVDGFAVKITLDPELFNKWGGKGTNIKTLKDEHAIVATDAHATIDGLPLPGANGDEYQDYIVNVEMQYPDDIPADVSKTYVWTMEQHKTANGNANANLNAAAESDRADGIAFEIHMLGDGDGAGRRNVAPTKSLGNDRLTLTAQPNILKGGTAISYSVGKTTSVSLVIQDINGRTIRTLLSGTETPAGNHQIEWDGKSSDGSLVPAGTYFYRLITPTGSTEQQLKIVR